MIFNSLTFAAFLTLVTALYWLLPVRPRLAMLLIASLTFYGFWDFTFVPLMLASIAIDYTAGHLLDRLPDGRGRKAVLVTAVALNLAILIYFKYTLFFSESLVGLAPLLGLDPEAFRLEAQIILPLGISFYTFQSMSYTVDVWRREQKAETDPLLFSVYVVYFPQLVAGPILRAGEVMWQLSRSPRFSWADIVHGSGRVVSGLFLKCVLADNLARLVDAGFARDPSSLGAIDVVTIAFLFGFQIYFDFAGYSHIALGASRMMGIHFPENFDFPYMAKTPRDFWRRWHISLSSWIRDYLYLPLCGARAGNRSVHGLDVAGRQGAQPGRRMAALWMTWFLMGLWHGANWTFAIWGLWHAALVTIHRLADKLIRRHPPAALTWALTLPAVMLGWIPFRAANIETTFALWARVVDPTTWLKPEAVRVGLPLMLTLDRDSYYATAVVTLAIVVAWGVRRSVLPRLDRIPAAMATADALVFAAAVPLVYLFLRPTAQFIYFQF